MLRKLIGYDFTSTWRLNTLLLGLSMAAATVGAVAMYFTEKITILATVAIFATIFAFFAPLAVMLLVAIHYHKKFFTDEAYLTFTLPATAGQHLASKLISGSIWCLASVLTIVVNGVIVVMSAMMQFFSDSSLDVGPEINQEIIESTYSVWTLIGDLGSVLFVIVSILSELALVYLALTISGNLAVKRKGLAGVGMYFLVNFIASTTMGIAESIIDAMTMTIPVEIAGAILPYINSALYIALGIAAILINRHILTNKLNLA